MIMNNAIVSNQTPNTYSRIVALQIHSETGSNLLLLSPYKYQQIPDQKYHSAMDASSYDSFTNSLNESLATVTIEDIVSNLYAKLTEAQEELGEEFKSVYFKNAWDLYES